MSEIQVQMVVRVKWVDCLPASCMDCGDEIEDGSSPILVTRDEPFLRRWMCEDCFYQRYRQEAFAAAVLSDIKDDAEDAK